MVRSLRVTKSLGWKNWLRTLKKPGRNRSINWLATQCELLEGRALLSAISFAEPIFIDAVPGPSMSVAVGDYNGDGILDLAVPDIDFGKIQSVGILLGNGDGTFADPIMTPEVFSPRWITAADFNNDGVLDLFLVSAYQYQQPGTLLLGNGDGTFQSPQFFEDTFEGIGSNRPFVTSADIDGDGNQDVVFNATEVLFGNGDGTFQPLSSFEPGTYPTAWDIYGYNASSGGIYTSIGDFNADGHTDRVTAIWFGERVDVQLGNGDGTFESPVSYGAGSGSTHVAVGDLNGDGNEDLAISNYHDGTVSILLGNGDGTFETTVDFTAEHSAYSSKIADFNQDGLPDLVVVSNAHFNISILLQVPMGDIDLASTMAVAEPTPLFILDSYDTIIDEYESEPDATPILDQESDAMFVDYDVNEDVVSDDTVESSDESLAPELVAEDDLETDDLFTDLEGSLLDDLLSVF